MDLLRGYIGGNQREAGRREAKGEEILGDAAIAQLQSASRVVDGNAVPANVADREGILVESGGARSSS